MRLLFITQVLDRQDPILGFTVRWIEGLAKHAEAVRVMALEVGDTSGLPDHVDWRVIGREGRLGRWLRFRGHLGEAFRDGFGHVLTHMVPRYSLLAAGPARRAGARHFMWYTHAGVDRRLRRAVGLVERAFTASPDSLRLEFPGKTVTGHGIDLAALPLRPAEEGEPIVLLSAGRMTPAKDPLTVLEAVALLRGSGHPVELEWAGGTLAQGDPAYAREVEGRIDSLGLAEHVRLLGPVPHDQMPEVFARSTAFLSTSRTGSVDKVVLEAMATGRPAVTSNASFEWVFEPLGRELSEQLRFPEGDANALAARVEGLLARGRVERDALGRELRSLVEERHEVDRLMRRLVETMEGPRP